MTGESCSAACPGCLFSPAEPVDLNGYVIGQLAGDGPNGGVAYIASANINMHLLEIVNNDLLPGGPSHPMVGSTTVTNGCNAYFGNANARTTHEVNNYCAYTAAFNSLVTLAWAHEAQHMNLALSAGAANGLDLPAALEALVSLSYHEMDVAAQIQIAETHSGIATAASASHTGASQSYQFWRFAVTAASGSPVWVWATTTVFM